MSKLLYMHDFDVENCDAIVVSVSAADPDRTDIMLDQTCFYPRGGGQDWDMGVITTASATFRVEEVRLDEQGDVHHVGRYEVGNMTIGEHATCRVDHDRREINTRLHSAGHVIDMAIDSLGLDWRATKGQHYPHLSAVEYSGNWQPERADELRTAIETRANELIRQNLENQLLFMSVDDMRSIVKHIPENIPHNKPSRVVMYGDAYGVPCGGTHVKHLGRIGSILIPKLKEKKGVIRVTYLVDGIRADA